jgi:hypothetical protein
MDTTNRKREFISHNPDIDPDVLWKPPRMSTRTRTTSMDSTDEAVTPTRRFSITEMFGFRPSSNSISSESSLRKQSLTESAEVPMDSDPNKKKRITERQDFLQFLKRQENIVDPN